MALLDINLKAVDECDFTNTSETDHSAQFYRTVLTIKNRGIHLPTETEVLSNS